MHRNIFNYRTDGRAKQDKKREQIAGKGERERKTGKRKSINMLASAKLKNLASLVYAHNMIFFIFYFRALRQGKVKSE